MSSIMRAPSRYLIVVIPLNGRTLQNNDCIVIVCPNNSAQNALAVYSAGSWTHIGNTGYSYSTSGDYVYVRIIQDGSSDFHACFLPSPVSS